MSVDLGKLIGVIQQFPQVWDRSSPNFREQCLKTEAWERIGEIMNCPGGTCKDTFKSLREKYVREREKQVTFGLKYIPWQHLDTLSFLDPHIILRKQTSSAGYDTKIPDIFQPDDGACNNRTAATPRDHHVAPVAGNNVGDGGPDSLLMQFAENHSDFDKCLIGLVRKATPIWDRKSNGYPSKQVKYQLWKSIAQAMKKDVNVCMMRWKGLREKYIRQKTKFQEGDSKWEFLDDMIFLDKVIQYRRKNCDPDYNQYNYHDSPYDSSFHPNFRAVKMYEEENSVSESISSDCLPLLVKNEAFATDAQQDSSYDSGLAVSTTVGVARKRSASDHSDASGGGAPFEKRDRVEYVTAQKTPEMMFGELVAAMLCKKNERDKNVAMIEIMKVLTK